MKTVFLDTDGLEDCDLTKLKSLCPNLTCYPTTSAEQVSERISDAEIVILNKVNIGREVLGQAKNLKMISVVATGTDVIDKVAAQKLGIPVCNCQGYGTGSVVQHVFSMLLALTTNLLPYIRDVRMGKWQSSRQFCFLDHPITELAGKTMGIVGYGTLGKGVASIAGAFGMDVVVARRPGGEPDDRPVLQEILPHIDVLSLHCPLTAQTKNLIGERELRAMKPTAILVNAARGGIVDEAALARALTDGTLGGAAIDVLSVEPPHKTNPLLGLDLPNLLVTPHIAWASREARQRIIDQTVENIQSYLAGDRPLLRCVNDLR